MTMLAYEEYQSPIGPLTILGDQDKIFLIEYGSFQKRKEKMQFWCGRNQLPTKFAESSPATNEALKQLTEYFNGKRKSFSIDYKLYGTPFQQKIWRALSEIPYGETCSYQDIAVKAESPKAVRAVGGANNKNPLSIIIPCHRVIGKNGKMIGYGGGLDKKEFLLDLENKRG